MIMRFGRPQSDLIALRSRLHWTATHQAAPSLPLLVNSTAKPAKNRMATVLKPLFAWRTRQNSREVVLLFGLLPALQRKRESGATLLWRCLQIRHICIYTYVECGHNASSTTFRSGLADRLTILRPSSERFQCIYTCTLITEKAF